MLRLLRDAAGACGTINARVRRDGAFALFIAAGGGRLYLMRSKN